MHRFFIAIFLLLQIAVRGQASCSSTMLSPQIYYPNTVNTVTAQGNYYLCGPNTTVQDSGFMVGWNAFASSNCTITTNINCPGAKYFFLKSGSVLNFGANSSQADVYFESGAIINNPFGISVYTVLCASLAPQPANCSTGVLENTHDNNSINIWPNPSAGRITITSIEHIEKFSDLVIIDQFGETVFEKKHCSFSEEDIDLHFLPNGLYSLQIKTGGQQQTKKLVLLRQT